MAIQSVFEVKASSRHRGVRITAAACCSQATPSRAVGGDTRLRWEPCEGVSAHRALSFSINADHQATDDTHNDASDRMAASTELSHRNSQQARTPRQPISAVRERPVPSLMGLACVRS